MSNALGKTGRCLVGVVLFARLDGACAHYVMVSKFQWKPIWLATQRDPQNDWTATQNRVNYDVFAQAPPHFPSPERFLRGSDRDPAHQTETCEYEP